MSEERPKSEAAPDDEKRARRARLIVLVDILIIAALLRFICLGQKSLWLDEVMSARVARMATLAEAVDYSRQVDVHPPFFAIVQWTWMRLGAGDAMARVPSAAFGLAAVYVLYLLARRIADERAALLAAGLLAVSPYHIYYSQEARNYALVALLALVLSWLIVRIVDAPAKQLPWLALAYAAAGVAAMYTFVMIIVLFAAHGVFLLVSAYRRRLNLAWGIGAMAAVGAAFVPWLPVLRGRMAVIDQIAATQGEVPGPGPVDLLSALREWMLAESFLLPPHGDRLEILLGLACVALIGLGLWRIRARRKALTPVICLLVLPVLFYLLLPMTRVHRFDPKHLVFVQPACLLAVAMLIAGRERSSRALTWLPVGLLVLVNIASLSIYYAPVVQKARWPEAASFIEENHAADYILVDPSRGVPFAFQYYYGGEMRVRGIDAGPVVPENAELKVAFDRVWLVSCWNEVIQPTPGLTHWFDTHATLEAEGIFFGAPGRQIRCALYRAKGAREASGRTPGAPD